MLVYLIEVVVKLVRPEGYPEKKKLEPIAVIEDLSRWKEVFEAADGTEGIIIEMEVGDMYPTGLGRCNHWHVLNGEVDSADETGFTEIVGEFENEQEKDEQAQALEAEFAEGWDEEEIRWNSSTLDGKGYNPCPVDGPVEPPKTPCPPPKKD